MRHLNQIESLIRYFWHVEFQLKENECLNGDSLVAPIHKETFDFHIESGTSIEFQESLTKIKKKLKKKSFFNFVDKSFIIPINIRTEPKDRLLKENINSIYIENFYF